MDLVGYASRPVILILVVIEPQGFGESVSGLKALSPVYITQINPGLTLVSLTWVRIFGV